MIKMTVITVCRNAEKDIEQTICSVLEQTYRNIEYIIMDGCSDDGTLSIVGRYQEQYAIQVYSEKDKGIYDAMNKGARIATGEYILFLNAGDTFYNKNTVKDMVNKFNKCKADIFYGGFAMKYHGRSIIREEDRGGMAFLLAGAMPCHQSIAATRKMILNNQFKLSYRIRSDFYWLLQCKKRKCRFQYINQCICFYSMNGYSARSKQQKRFEEETLRALQDFMRLPKWVYKKYKKIFWAVYNITVNPHKRAYIF